MYIYLSYIDTDEIPGFFHLLKNHLFTARSENTYMLFAGLGLSVLGKSVSEVLRCLSFSVGNNFMRNICVDFLLKQFHTLRVRLTFLEVCFLRLDNKIHFRYDGCHYPNP